VSITESKTQKPTIRERPLFHKSKTTTKFVEDEDQMNKLQFPFEAELKPPVLKEEETEIKIGLTPQQMKDQARFEAFIAFVSKSKKQLKTKTKCHLLKSYVYKDMPNLFYPVNSAREQIGTRAKEFLSSMKGIDKIPDRRNYLL
jgi:hypothetical protein